MEALIEIEQYGSHYSDRAVWKSYRIEQYGSPYRDRAVWKPL